MRMNAPDLIRLRSALFDICRKGFLGFPMPSYHPICPFANLVVWTVGMWEALV